MRAHRNAVIADLESRLPGSVFGSYSAARGSRYAVVFIGRAAKRQTRFTGPQAQDVFTVTVHSVGVDEDSALWVEERVSQLTDKVLVVPGRRLFPVSYSGGQPVMLNDEGVDPLWYTVTSFDIYSNPGRV